MAFFLVNAPATFQRITFELFGEQLFKSVICYLDDNLVYSKSATENADHVGDAEVNGSMF